MKYSVTDQPAGPVLILQDQLTFDDREGFGEIIDKVLTNQPQNVTVDLSQLDYMDSAGLGMLLTLRDRAQKVGAEVLLRSPKTEVSNLLRLACFDTLFQIEA